MKRIFRLRKKHVLQEKLQKFPTNHSVLAETMHRSLQIAQESKKKSIAVTYDLALSKFPMQTKKKKSLVYGNIFIALYSFHIEMAYFKDLGENMHCICTNQKTFAFGENLLNFKLPGTPYISWHLILLDFLQFFEFGFLWIILSNFL